ncbi:Abi-alpha family protein [uncultured Draconibacterium sp.]|uniref:Abi-alpha family protein n=1 Tax=uncultured Draconibacterium sp. TaxID=1573823 RepID=UPI0025CC8DDD|nr:Abi-alpha family protein [uncultured Draconibacterium sp.]
MLEPESTQKTIEVVTPFLEKIVNPPFNELGLLFQDRVRLWRFNNQLKIVAKAQKMVEEHNITIQPVSLKILAPLLDMGSLEEEPKLQDMWAKLLVSYTDASLHLKSTIFPHILSQLSCREAEVLIYNFQNDQIYRFKNMSSSDGTGELKSHELTNLSRLGLLENNYQSLGNFGGMFKNKLFKEIHLTPLCEEFLRACTKIRD